MSTETDRILRLSKGDAYKIKVETAAEMADETKRSPFRDVYSKAIQALKEIHADNTEKAKSTSSTNQYEGKPSRPTEVNPVIGFCGERGSGKTSAMVSFRDALADWKNTCELPFFSVLKSSNFSFICLQTVDPSVPSRLKLPNPKIWTRMDLCTFSCRH